MMLTLSIWFLIFVFGVWSGIKLSGQAVSAKSLETQFAVFGHFVKGKLEALESKFDGGSKP